LFSGKVRDVHNVVFGQQGPRLATVRDARWKLHVLAAGDTRADTTAGRWLDPRAPDGVTILAPFEQSQPAEYPGIRTGDLPRAMSLFDLENDPAEQHDVAAQNPDVVARLKKSVDVIAEKPAGPTVNRGQAPAAMSIDDIVVADPSPSEPVTALMTIRPKCATVGETVDLLVHIRIARAHFIYSKDDAGGPFVPVAVKATLPEGVEPISDWRLPTPEKGRGNSLVYRDSVLLRRSLKVVSSSSPRSLTVRGELQYQVCTDELCWPKGKLELSAPLMIQPRPR
jgi:Disulphide bond corrector protein DsbC